MTTQDIRTRMVERLREDIDRLNDHPAETIGAPYSMCEAADALEAALQRIEELTSAVTYAAETTNDKHTSRKLLAVLSPSSLGDE